VSTVVLIIVLLVAAAVVVAIAFVAVGHAVGTTESMPDQIVFDAEEAISFCAEALPDEVTATLSYDELRRVLRYHFEFIQAYHFTPSSRADVPVVFEQFDPLDYVMERAAINRLEISRDHAAAVIQAHSDYLQVMGALHIDDPVDVEADLAELPLLDGPELEASSAEALPDGDDPIDR
jgi:hypothetical protein